MSALAARQPQQPDQTGAEQPDRTWYRHRADIARLNSPRQQTVELLGRELVAVAEAEVPRAAGIQLSTGPVVEGLDVTKGA